MPTYTLDLKIPKNTLKDLPIEHPLKIDEGVITRVSVLIPAGHHALAGMRILYGIRHFFPAGEDQWLSGEDESVIADEFWDLPEQPCTLRVQGFNIDDTYDHTFYIRITALPREAALAHRLYLRRLGDELAKAVIRATVMV